MLADSAMTTSRSGETEDGARMIGDEVESPTMRTLLLSHRKHQVPTHRIPLFSPSQTRCCRRLQETSIPRQEGKLRICTAAKPFTPPEEFTNFQPNLLDVKSVTERNVSFAARLELEPVTWKEKLCSTSQNPFLKVCHSVASPPITEIDWVSAQYLKSGLHSQISKYLIPAYYRSTNRSPSRFRLTGSSAACIVFVVSISSLLRSMDRAN